MLYVVDLRLNEKNQVMWDGVNKKAALCEVMQRGNPLCTDGTVRKATLYTKWRKKEKKQATFYEIL